MVWVAMLVMTVAMMMAMMAAMMIAMATALALAMPMAVALAVGDRPRSHRPHRTNLSNPSASMGMAPSPGFPASLDMPLPVAQRIISVRLRELIAVVPALRKPGDAYSLDICASLVFRPAHPRGIPETPPDVSLVRCVAGRVLLHRGGGRRLWSTGGAWHL